MKPSAHLHVIMGVSGCGKSTVGQQVASQLGLGFYDGDDFHSDANRLKMTAGVPLTDDDRAPWLESIVDFAAQRCRQGKSLVVACSALKRMYRDQLRKLPFPVRFVHLTASATVIETRLKRRQNHFMPDDLLASQFHILESPAGETGVTEVSAEQPSEAVVQAVVRSILEATELNE